MTTHSLISIFFFFNDTATTEIYTLSLHDALPISTFRNHNTEIKDNISKNNALLAYLSRSGRTRKEDGGLSIVAQDRKSTRLNSSHGYISYAVFCLKKKKTNPFSPTCRP